MTAAQQFIRWRELATDDPDLTAELKPLDVLKDEQEIEDRFARPLAFGTNGMRGLLGAGSSRVNLYTVRQAAQGLAAYLLAKGETCPVAIGYDSREKSKWFASEAAQLLATGGFPVWIFPRPVPTPALSFAVKHLGCCAGLAITAGHNPAGYSGLTVYNAQGAQMDDKALADLYARIREVDPFEGVPVFSCDSTDGDTLIHMMEEDVLDAYIRSVVAQSTGKAPGQPLKVVYTPLNGAGRECVVRALEGAGITDVTLVPEQAMPDGGFATCPQPDPQSDAALELGLRLSRRLEADVLLATDPACGRLGVAVKHENGYRQLTGNEMGVLLFDFVCKTATEAGRMPAEGLASASLVSTGMARHVAARHGVQLLQTLPGFRHIAEELREPAAAERFVFGFEESGGTLAGGSAAMDKDAVAAALLVCEMARFYKAAGGTLADAAQHLYDRYGYVDNRLHTFTFPGLAGRLRIEEALQALRGYPPEVVAKIEVAEVTDYTRQLPATPPAQMLGLRLADGSLVYVRGAGTQPKLKIYIETTAESRQAAIYKNGRIAKAMQALLKLEP